MREFLKQKVVQLLPRGLSQNTEQAEKPMMVRRQFQSNEEKHQGLEQEEVGQGLAVTGQVHLSAGT